MTSSAIIELTMIRSFLFCLIMLPIVAQENYEIQVYGSETMKPGRTMVELHSNFTIKRVP